MSIAALVVGVAAATENLSAILIAGVSGVVAGAISMAAGEYVSVSTQRDSEQAVMDRESGLLEANPEEELAELQKAWENKGLSAATAAVVAKELTEHDALAAHFEVQMGSAGTHADQPLARGHLVVFLLYCRRCVAPSGRSSCGSRVVDPRHSRRVAYRSCLDRWDFRQAR